MNDPGYQIGRCHICKRPDQPIQFCPECGHHFCPGCQGRWFERGLEALMEMVGIRTPGCCGPREVEIAAQQLRP
jgi:Zn-finger nucleic acid-binding protein